MSDWSEVVAGAVGAGLVIAVQVGMQGLKNRRDSKRIYVWLCDESKKPNAKSRRTTRAIAQALSLTPERAAELCHNHPKIHTTVHGREDVWSLSPIRSGF